MQRLQGLPWPVGAKSRTSPRARVAFGEGRRIRQKQGASRGRPSRFHGLCRVFAAARVELEAPCKWGFRVLDPARDQHPTCCQDGRYFQEKSGTGQEVRPLSVKETTPRLERGLREPQRVPQDGSDLRRPHTK
jgi:hypothetical protein